MGSMWVDPNEDPRVYPTVPTAGLPVPNFDPANMTSVTKYSKDRWGADFVSMVGLIEFTRQANWQNLVRVGISSPPPKKGTPMEDALKQLVEYQRTERTVLLPEILAQSGDFQMYFCSQLGLYPRSHPRSYLMLKIVARIGELVMVYLKKFYASESVRPSHIYPRLTPPIPVPPHASYPSGHAMISYLLALMAKELVPDLGDAAKELAERIARNREVAGVHFHWDSVAGATAADNTFKIIKTLDAYLDRIDDAKLEWK